jgi:8-oxo-dGTP pyrophosphatase MutT (NUDIX family)
LELGAEGHVTGSAAVLNFEKDALALIWHEKLARWLQPGGHCEETDKSVIETARRELLEETELPGDSIELALPEVFDVDVHFIPARPDGSEPGHYHYDVRFLFQLTRPEDFPEDLKASWVPLSEAISHADESIARLAKKALRTHTAS